FPIICEPCLGDNPYMRMTTQESGAECKSCSRPFTTYRWLPGAGLRYRHTQICTDCAKLKNVCQACILDLEFGLATHVRDAVLGAGASSALPSSEANRRWMLRAADNEMEHSGKSLVDYARIDAVAKDTLKKLSRSHGDSPYASSASANGGTTKPRAAGICSLWLKGKCTRGKDCSYRHVLPKDKDKLAKFYADNPSLQHHQGGGQSNHRHARDQLDTADPARSSSTLLVSKIPTESCTESALRDHFRQFGDIRSVVVAAAKHCAFVNFTT
ncbi:hypothetical protein BC828DRAFT_331895, partial [Blastocladiella britannica]